MGNKKRLVLVGPVYPYKGGIAHYTGLMYRALSKQHEVYMISYKVQYPKLLFKKEQKDYSNDSFKIESTNYWINTVNPFNWFQSAGKIRRLKPDLVIIQWWHPYFAPCYWGLCKLLRGIDILFVCHNVFPHERFPMDRLLTRKVLSNGDFFIVQSKQDEMDLLSIKKNAVYRRTVHPTYNVFKFKGLTREAGRELLGYGSGHKLLLFFGFVREYKGLKHLLRAMPAIIACLPDARLLVVGDFAEDKDSYLKLASTLGVRDYIDIYDEYIPDTEVEKFFAACDLVILPYESATQSGIVQIAYGFGRPVVATCVGGLPEVVEDRCTGYVVEPGNPGAITAAVCSYFQDSCGEVFAENIRREAYRFSWDRMAEIIDGMTMGNFGAAEKLMGGEA